MTSERRVLVVEDERSLADMLVYNLARGGFHAEAVYDGQAALQSIAASAPDLVILDVMLPGLAGTEVARRVRTEPRTARIPILMLTARGEEQDQVAGLSVGADDYVTKPFSVKILLARVAALLRRSSPAAADPARLRVGPVTADLAAHTVSVEGRDVRLTLTEYRLLVAMLQGPRRVLSRSELIGKVMGPGVVITARTVDVHVAALRKKMGVAGAMIQTIRGVGYRLVETFAPVGAGPQVVTV